VTAAVAADQPPTFPTDACEGCKAPIDPFVPWVAGFSDGEGTVRINAATSRNLGALIVSITQVDTDVLTPIAARWGGRIRAATGMRPDQRQAYVWTAAANAALRFLLDIEPFIMSARNRERIALAREFQEGARPGGRIPPDEDEVYRGWRFGCWLRMRRLNRRGVSAA
jgi:hypothetical protein